MRVLVNTQKLSQVYGANSALSAPWHVLEELARQRPDIEWVVALDEDQPAGFDALRAACADWPTPPELQLWGTGLSPHPDKGYTVWAAQVQSIVWEALVRRNAVDMVLHLDEESELETMERTLDVQATALKIPKGGFSRKSDTRPLLALVSPLPDAKSGIADYAQDLIPELSAWYEIELIVEQDAQVNRVLSEQFVTRTLEYFIQNPGRYSRVVYQMGNSQFHQHMFKLMGLVPGIVVLHDFFLGETLNVIEHMGNRSFALTRAAYHSHGYGALLAIQRQRYNADGLIDWPSNLGVLEAATGILVHSAHAKSLIQHWAGPNLASLTRVLPMPRKAPAVTSRQAARARLGISEDVFLVCSMGMMGPTKCNDRLVQAWLASTLKDHAHFQLVFVGQADSNQYGQSIQEIMETNEVLSKIRITGWCNEQTYNDYLSAADLAVQLRSYSRGEMSAAALDCMNYGVPLIANAHGALAELPPYAIKFLPEEFSNDELVEALLGLYHSRSLRAEMGQSARLAIECNHRPEACASAYFQAIEEFYEQAEAGLDGVIKRVGRLQDFVPDNNVLLNMAKSISRTFAAPSSKRQLLVDVSAICRNDLKTGIQRVVRAVVWELIQAPPPGFRIEPVYLSELGQLWHYRYARRWTNQILALDSEWCEDDVLVALQGDILFVADLTSGLAIEAHRAGVYEVLRRRGVSLNFCVYDLLPIRMPHFFPAEAGNFAQWLDTVVQVADSALCISNAVAQDLRDWIAELKPSRLTALKVDYFHLGADIESSIPTRGIGGQVRATLDALRDQTSFLMVGTIEPRKGHSQTFEAFATAWQSGHDLHLVIVGKQGWDGQVTDRRTVSAMVEQWRAHPEWGKRLHWLPSVTDEELNAVYRACDCLIAASEGEGFGLPLIEAAQHKTSIIARDIAVFREVAGASALYFSGLEPVDVVRAVKRWLVLHERGEAPTSTSMRWLTWQQSVTMLLKKLNLT